MILRKGRKLIEFILNSFVWRISKSSKYKVFDTFIPKLRDKIRHSELTLMRKLFEILDGAVKPFYC